MRLQDPAKLAAAMRERRMSGRELANEVGCSNTFISFLLRGTKTTCRPETGLLIEEALQVARGAIFDRMESDDDEQIARGERAVAMRRARSAAAEAAETVVRQAAS